MNFQWQSLLCQVEAGLLKMFGDEEEGPSEEGERPPQYTLPLRGAEVLPGPDTDHSYRISLCLHGLQMAVLEVGESPAPPPLILRITTIWITTIWIRCGNRVSCMKTFYTVAPAALSKRGSSFSAYII